MGGEKNGFMSPAYHVGIEEMVKGVLSKPISSQTVTDIISLEKSLMSIYFFYFTTKPLYSFHYHRLNINKIVRNIVIGKRLNINSFNHGLCFWIEKVFLYVNNDQGFIHIFYYYFSSVG